MNATIPMEIVTTLDILRTEQVRACASLNAFDLVDALGLDDDA